MKFHINMIKTLKKIKKPRKTYIFFKMYKNDKGYYGKKTSFGG